MRVLDLGASPGSWSFFLLDRLGEKGSLCAVDLKPLSFEGRHREKKEDPRLKFFRGDLTSEACRIFLEEEYPFDLVVSDAAPATTGHRLVDTEASLELVSQVRKTAAGGLRPGGHLVMKIFEGGEEELGNSLREDFQTFKRFRPKPVRKSSFEYYFVCKGYRGRGQE